jgi:hypothetical protein
MGYIFEAEIESIIHAVRIKTIGEDDGIALKKILSSDIHPAVKAYFKAEVEKMLMLERGLEHRSKKFSYSLPEVRSLEEQIDLLLIQNYNFSLQEFESLLDESVHFQFNYLCRPQWTLMNFIMGEQNAVSTSKIEKCLMYCVDYTYFPELIKRYIIDHGLAEVNYNEFKTLIEKIDREVVAQHSSIELAHMTRALFEFVESGKMVPQVEFEQQTLPINAAIVFFDDKHLPDICARLEYERDNNRVVQITVDHLADIIEIERTENKEISLPPDNSKAIISDKTQDTIVQINNQGTDTIIDNTVKEQIAIEISQKVDNPIPVEIISPISEEIDNESPVPDSSTKRQELLDLFSEEERNLLIKEIFSKDEPAFHGAITEISVLEDWREAAQYLDTLFIANGVNAFSAEAVLFTDKLYAHFHSIENSE